MAEVLAAGVLVVGELVVDGEESEVPDDSFVELDEVSLFDDEEETVLALLARESVA